MPPTKAYGAKMKSVFLRSVAANHPSSGLINQRLRKVEAIKVHHLVPGRDKVVDELLFSVGTSVNFNQGTELGV
jgi:hypothetical protein